MSSGSGPGRKLTIAALVAVAFAAAVATVLVAKVEFPHGTTDLDEVAYQSQADAIAHHELTLPVATHDPFFRPFLSGVRDDRVVFKYQPEWPALIAASDGVFGSTLPLRVLMSIAGVLAVAWFAWESTRDARVVVGGSALLVASPFTWMQTASLLGYELSFVLGTAAAAALLRSVARRSAASGLAAGALLGCAILHRPFDALLATAPVIAYWCWNISRRREFGRGVLPVAAGGLPFAAIFFAYNRSVMGAFTRLAYNVTGPADTFGFGWRASFGSTRAGHSGRIDYTLGRAFTTLGHLFVALPRFVAFAPAVAVLAGVCVWSRRRTVQVWLLTAMIGVVVVGYFFWWGVANSYAFKLEQSLGPFYYYPVLAPLCVLAAWGAVSVARSKTLVAVLVIVGIAWGGIASLAVLRNARDAGEERSADVRALDAPPPSLVLAAPKFPNDPYLRVATDAALRAPHLVALDVPGRRLELVDRFPGRATYLARSYRRFGDPFGPEEHDRVVLRVVRGRGIEVHLHVSLGRGRRGKAFLRLGDGPAQLSAPRAGAADTAFGLTAGLLPSDGRPLRIAVGVTITRPGATAVTPLTGEWIECGTEARTLPDREIEILEMCDGRHHYTFPNDVSATITEDVGPAMQITVTNAR